MFVISPNTSNHWCVVLCFVGLYLSSPKVDSPSTLSSIESIESCTNRQNSTASDRRVYITTFTNSQKKRRREEEDEEEERGTGIAQRNNHREWIEEGEEDDDDDEMTSCSFLLLISSLSSSFELSTLSPCVVVCVCCRDNSTNSSAVAEK